MKKYLTLLGALVLSVSTVASGCVVYSRPARPVVYAYGGWQPLYYNGYVVYFTPDGIPYYYVGGRIVYVPRSHWHLYRPYFYRHRVAYWRWHRRFHRPRYWRYRRIRRRRALRRRYARRRRARMIRRRRAVHRRRVIRRRRR